MAQTSVSIIGTSWELEVTVDVFHKWNKELIGFCDDYDYLVSFEACGCNKESCSLCNVSDYLEPVKLYPASFSMMNDERLVIRTLERAPSLEQSVAAVKTVKGLGLVYENGGYVAPSEKCVMDYLLNSDQAKKDIIDQARNEMGLGDS